MAVIPEVTIGPFENLDGSKAVTPLVERRINLWVSWSTDPGAAFTANGLQISSNRGSWDESSPGARNRLISKSIVKRIDNRFLFNLRFRGIEDWLRFRVPGNIFNGNAQTDLLVYTLNYTASLSNPVVPSDKITGRTHTFTYRSNRGRRTWWHKEDISLEGIVNGAIFSSRDAIESITLPRTPPQPEAAALGNVTASSDRNFTVDVGFPPNSKGVVRLRYDKYSAFTDSDSAGDENRYNFEFLGKGPQTDAVSDAFEFDNVANTTTTLTRGVEGTGATSHAENSEITLIDQVIDVRDGRWVIKPLDEVKWKSDTQSLYNQIRIIYGDGEEFYAEDPQSVFENGGREFRMNTPLGSDQTHWARWISQNFLTSFSKLQHTAILQLKLSIHLKLGQVIYLRGLTTDAIRNVVQIVGIEHSVSNQFSTVTVRTVPRANPQTFTAPVFSTQTFTDGETVRIFVDRTLITQLQAVGNPSPTITATGAPSWFNIDAQGNIRATPTAEGMTTITFTAANGVSPDATFSITFDAVASSLWGSGDWSRFIWS